MGRPLVAAAESLAAWPGPATAPSIAANATIARKRRNPINSSPARTRQPDCFELPLVSERLESPNPLCSCDDRRRFGSLVLVLARPSAREDGTQEAPNFPGENRA